MQDDFPEMQISDVVSSIPEALSVYMNNVVYKMKHRGEKLSVLSLGEAFFNIPYFGFEDIDFEKGYHYSESQGLPELRERISKYYKKQYNADIDPETELLISAGSKPLIFMALRSVLNTGDEVLVHEPTWLSYPEEIKLAGGSPGFIPYDCDIHDFLQYFTSKTRVVILNNPNNPAGKVYPRDDLQYLYSECRRRGIYILVDEAYSDFLEDSSFCSMANIVPSKDGVIIVNSLSKNLGISGWRVGYVISSPKIIYQILKLNQHLITCPATIILMYLAKHFDDISAATLPQARSVVKKRNEISKYLEDIKLAQLPGSSTFYIFVSVGDYRYTSLELALYLLTKYHISVVPGSAYGKSTERFIRIGVGVAPTEEIKQSIDIIRKVIETSEYDDSYVESTLSQLGIKRFESLE